MRLVLLTLTVLMCACAPVAHAAPMGQAPQSVRLFVPLATRDATAGASASQVIVTTVAHAPGPLHAIAASGAGGWAVGNDGVIVSTRDGGATWTPRSSGTREHLYAVAAASPDVAWAGGWRGTIVATTDGGTTWRAQATGTTGAIRAISAVSDVTAWAVGDRGTLLRTVDGGATWSPLPAPTRTGRLRGIATTSATSAWIVSQDGVIYHTADGGATWRVQWVWTPPLVPSQPDLGVSPWIHLYDVAAVSDQVAWAVGLEELPDPSIGVMSVGVAMATNDGGATWTRQSLPDGVLDVYAAAAGSPTVWMASFDGRVHATRDGGVTWTSGAADAVGTMTGMVAVGADRVWVVGQGGALLEGRYVAPLAR